MKIFKIKGIKTLAELRNPATQESDSIYGDDYFEEYYTNHSTLWQRVSKFGKSVAVYLSRYDRMRLRIIQLENTLAATLREAETAGKNGWDLLSENEQLKARISIAQASADPEVLGQYWVRKSELDKKQKELDEMTKINRRLVKDFEDVNKLRMDAEIRANALRAELDQLKKEQKNG